MISRLHSEVKATIRGRKKRKAIILKRDKALLREEVEEVDVVAEVEALVNPKHNKMKMMDLRLSEVADPNQKESNITTVLTPMRLLLKEAQEVAEAEVEEVDSSLTLGETEFKIDKLHFAVFDQFLITNSCNQHSMESFS